MTNEEQIWDMTKKARLKLNSAWHIVGGASYNVANDFFRPGHTEAVFDLIRAAVSALNDAEALLRDAAERLGAEGDE